MGKKGLLVVISAPSGSGKTTILRKVFESGNGNFRYSISATTRPQRPEEKNGRDYHFLSVDEFRKKRSKSEFIEWAEVHGNYYATLKNPIKKWLDDGKLVFLDLDVHGGLEVKKQFGDSSILIFVKPPSFQSLIQRLKDRKTETQAEIEKRLERYPEEMKKSEYYDYHIVNEDLEQTIKNILQVIDKHYSVS